MSNYFDSSVPILILFDDLMRTVMNDDTDRTPSNSEFRFPRTGYDLRPRQNRFILFANNNFEMGQVGASRKV